MRCIAFISFVAFLATFGCNSSPTSQLEKFENEKDSFYYHEFIVAKDRHQIDTILQIKMNLINGENSVWLAENLNVGIELVQKFQPPGHVFNILYAALEEEKRVPNFKELNDQNTRVKYNFSTNKPIKRIDASSQVFMSINSPLVVAQDIFKEERLSRIIDIIKENSPYSKVEMYSVISDAKYVKLRHHR